MGIAVSDPQAQLAFPLKVLPLEEVKSLARPFRILLEDYEVEALICGLPMSLNGELGAQAERIQEIAQGVAEKLRLELFYVDERFSSQEAKRRLHEMGLTEKQMRGKLDMYAAALILEAFIGKQALATEDGGGSDKAGATENI